MTAERAGPAADERVAIIDCGTNTIRMLIASSDGRGGLTEHERRAEIVRLGQGVDATGEFHPDALQRTFEAAERYAAVIRATGVPDDNIRFLATSASRDANNREEFFAGVRQRIGVTPEIITGDIEAGYSFAGALAGIADLRTPALVMDIGGGSTELILGQGQQSVTATASLDIGSVRLTERCWTSDPPDPADLTRARSYVDDMLEQQDPGWRQARTWIGVAGTLTTLAAVHQNLTSYDRSRVHGHTISTRDLDDLFGLAGSRRAGP